MKFLVEFLKKQRKFNKTAKNTCKRFCKPLSLKKYKQFAKKHKSYSNISKEIIYNSYIKSYCNPKCKGYTNIMGRRFRKTIKNGFSKEFSNNQIAAMKAKGAESGCVNMK